MVTAQSDQGKFVATSSNDVVLSFRGTELTIENGILDDHVDTIARQRFAEEMNMHGVKNLQFHDHYNSEHGFALAPGVISTKYDEPSDRRSTISMFLLFQELWGKHGFFPHIEKDEVNACGTEIGKYWGGSMSHL